MGAQYLTTVIYGISETKEMERNRVHIAKEEYLGCREHGAFRSLSIRYCPTCGKKATTLKKSVSRVVAPDEFYGGMLLELDGDTDGQVLLGVKLATFNLDEQFGLYPMPEPSEGQREELRKYLSDRDIKEKPKLFLRLHVSY